MKCKHLFNWLVRDAQLEGLHCTTMASQTMNPLTSTERVLLDWLILALVRAMGDPHRATSCCTKVCSGILSPTSGTPGLRVGLSSGVLSNTVVTGPGRRRERRSDGTVTLAQLRWRQMCMHQSHHNTKHTQYIIYISATGVTDTCNDDTYRLICYLTCLLQHKHREVLERYRILTTLSPPTWEEHLVLKAKWITEAQHIEIRCKRLAQ